MDQKKFEQLQRTVKGLEQESDKAKGGLTQLLDQLEEKYGCVDVKETQERLADLEEQEGKLTRQYEQALREFEEMYEENLGGIQEED